MAKPENLADAEITESLRPGASEAQRRRALRQLYESRDLYLMVSDQVRHFGGNDDDVREVFQETLVLFERAVRENRFGEKSKVSTYFTAIAKWHWLNTLRKTRKLVNLETVQHDGETESVDISVIAQERRSILAQGLGTLGERCKELLRYWTLSYSPEELCGIFGFSSTDMAKKETYRCRQRLRDFFDKNQHLLNELKDA